MKCTICFYKNTVFGQYLLQFTLEVLAKPHDILLIDEPTAIIDLIQERSVYESLLQESKMILLITHRLGSVRRADYILILKAGKLIASGTHTELMVQCPYYNQLYSSQADMYKN